ncbi:MAG: Hsp70 family protein [Candidatus Bruticola sp.]
MIIGIDLGTTNCAVAWSDPDAISSEQKTRKETPPIHHFAISQLTYPATVEHRSTLPSFLYFPGTHELPPGSLELPWDKNINSVVGYLAREQGAKVPHRVVSSAKSWLSGDQADRNAPILPWNAPDEVEHISPIDASSRYLEHLRSAWDFEHPECPLAEQQIVLTVPASFDTIARELTVQAAHKAGLTKLTLLEEPQAAFYAWLDNSEKDWRSQVAVGDKILVCDIGGGTTDFSLISVTNQDGNLSLERSAVGDHILLGGDNMDLTLAVCLQQKLKAERKIKLDSWQMQILTHACRTAKEQLLQEDGEEEWNVTIPGRGSSLIASSITVPLSRQLTEQLIVDGFFPKCSIEDQAVRSRQSGLRELGLPFESDPAVTKHLARFLTVNKPEDSTVPFFAPTAILFNGGVLKAPMLRRRLTETLNSWLASIGAPPVKELEGADYDLAVARGAVRSGLASHGAGIRIKAGTNRSYYLGIETSMPAVPGLTPPIKALCTAPFGMEEDSREKLPGRSFGLVVGEPVEFRFLASTCRQQDQLGDLIDDWEDDMEELPPLQVTLPAEMGEVGKIIPVTLETHVTEVGTLEVWCCQENVPKWRLEFEVRSSGRS